tara:strand:- start:149 stop:1246 length:1098 start_codon:yes stop_codon:yes gene_type:complete
MSTFTYESLKNRFRNPTVDGNLELFDDGAIIKIADGELQFTHSGSAGTISNSTGNLTVDVAGDIILDADGANLTFKDGGTSVLDISNSSTDAVLTVSTQDKDLIIKGDDAGSSITAATFDMSDAGTLVLNHDIRIADGGQIGSASDADAITIASDGVVTFSQAVTLNGGLSGDLAISNLDIDGGTDIGAALVDADLIIVDDGAGGTNRKAALSRMKTFILSSVYPVGSIFISTSSTDPGDSSQLGFGSWSRFGEGKMLVSQNSSDTDFDTAEETGGAKTHTLSTGNLPSHDHFIMNTGNGFGNNLENNTSFAGTTNSRGGLGNNDYIMQAINSDPNAGRTSSTGSGDAVTHMNPYIVTYMWKRTS